MRVVVPFVPRAYHPLARASHDFIPGLERYDVSDRDDAYWRLVCELWSAGESFCLIEQDIEVTPEDVAAMALCAEPWCSAPYHGPGHGLIRRSLGFVKFSADLLRDEPDLMGRVGEIRDAIEVGPGHWRRLDARMDGELRRACVEPHEHAQVLHHHLYQVPGTNEARCACQRRHREFPVGAMDGGGWRYHAPS